MRRQRGSNMGGTHALHLVVKIAEGGVAEARLAVVDGRDGEGDLVHGLEDSQKLLHGLERAQ